MAAVTFKGAVRKARRIYVFAVVRLADGSDSAVGYVQITRAELLFQLREGWLQRIEPEWHTENDFEELYVG